MNKIIAVTSGKGGTGKSTFSVNLGIAAARADQRVLLIDMDAGMRCLDLMLGVSESVFMDVSDVANGTDLESSVIPVQKYSGLFLLPAPAEHGMVQPELFGKLVLDAAEKYSLIIIDFPAGSDITFYENLPRNTDFLCVCNPDPISVRDASLIGQSLRSISRKGYLIINKYNYKYIANKSFNNLDDILNETGLQLLGIVPLSDRFIYSFSTGYFPRRGREAKAFRRIYSRISGRPMPLPKLKKI